MLLLISACIHDTNESYADYFYVLKVCNEMRDRWDVLPCQCSCDPANYSLQESDEEIKILDAML